MFDEPDEQPDERSQNPADRAKEKTVELCMYSELFAVFEGPRKFDARLFPGLDMQIARDVQQSMARLEKSKSPDSPVLPPPSAQEAAATLNLATVRNLSTNDYHIHRRPGEVMIVRWLEGDQVQTFYDRLQAHFDAALTGYREDERQSQEWKQDPATLKYLGALEAIDLKMADRYLRDPIRQSRIFVLSTQTTDEMNIAFLTDQIMGVSPAELVGNAAAPSDAPTERDLAWFFKLFSLRGIVEETEKMCFFIYLQKSDDSSDSDW
jgi:hypothetical protein